MLLPCVFRGTSSSPTLLASFYFHFLLRSRAHFVPVAHAHNFLRALCVCFCARVTKPPSENKKTKQQYSRCVFFSRIDIFKRDLQHIAIFFFIRLKQKNEVVERKKKKKRTKTSSHRTEKYYFIFEMKSRGNRTPYRTKIVAERYDIFIIPLMFSTHTRTHTYGFYYREKTKNNTEQLEKTMASRMPNEWLR